MKCGKNRLHIAGTWWITVGGSIVLNGESKRCLKSTVERQLSGLIETRGGSNKRFFG